MNTSSSHEHQQHSIDDSAGLRIYIHTKQNIITLSVSDSAHISENCQYSITINCYLAFSDSIINTLFD